MKDDLVLYLLGHLTSTSRQSEWPDHSGYYSLLGGRYEAGEYIWHAGLTWVCDGKIGKARLFNLTAEVKKGYLKAQRHSGAAYLSEFYRYLSFTEKGFDKLSERVKEIRDASEAEEVADTLAGSNWTAVIEEAINSDPRFRESLPIDNVILGKTKFLSVKCLGHATGRDVLNIQRYKERK